MKNSNSDQLVYIHADESCLGNQFKDKSNPGGAAGLVEAFEGRRGWTRHDYYVCERDTTNNRMAIRSAIEGLRTLKRAQRVVFYSDSTYLVQGMKEWIHNWAARGWKRKGGAIENLELWRQLDRIAAPYLIEWRWVRGHAGDPKNEYVDHLAMGAARKQRSSGGLVPSRFTEWVKAQQERDRFLNFFDTPPDPTFEADRPSPATRIHHR